MHCSWLSFTRRSPAEVLPGPPQPGGSSRGRGQGRAPGWGGQSEGGSRSGDVPVLTTVNRGRAGFRLRWVPGAELSNIMGQKMSPAPGISRQEGFIFPARRLHCSLLGTVTPPGCLPRTDETVTRWCPGQWAGSPLRALVFRLVGPWQRLPRCGQQGHSRTWRL